MKTFVIPEFYRSPIISEVKKIRKESDPRKKDFSPSVLDFGDLQLFIPRHFGFCYGVENAIEKSYRALDENPGKRIFLLSQMIHNPAVNEDLLSHGIRFLQDTNGKQLIPWEELAPEDIVIIPAFGTTLEIKDKLNDLGIEHQTYNTTCPFVEKVWNRSEKLGSENYTVIIHGKASHEETRATFSHSASSSPSLIVKDMKETELLKKFILGELPLEEFDSYFSGKYSEDFDPGKHLDKIGVVNQTTMLATETQAIADFLKQTMIDKFGNGQLADHFADTRDTLCYATNDNQSATLELLNYSLDAAFVIGGHNSSNTTHLVEILEEKFKTFFIRDANSLNDDYSVDSFDIYSKEIQKSRLDFSNKPLKIAVTAGASCPDSIVDRVIQRIIELTRPEKSLQEALQILKQQ
ncbi:MAG: 4-hydroxy-3-methylbut-2-enyl diphosphate reductase [Flavobacteriia bacterium]|nr:4-hydroxy-3-methylbut-2-enyl diphosphate reductase [Flavobacteriia bacterium]OJX36806.1 MAG: 4-hydroxy-3-methylbut-2-enyl diphosphate reductase [Flavobacteriia bacterium 40-80]